MHATLSSLTATGSHCRPAASVTRTPMAKPTFRPTPSLLLVSSRTTAPVPAFPTLPFPAHPTQRQAIVPAAVSRGPVLLNFLETSQPDVDGLIIKPAELVMSPGCEKYRGQLSKGVLQIEGAIPPDWMREIYKHLNSSEAQDKLEEARSDYTVELVCLKNRPLAYKKLLCRLSQHPTLSDTRCTIRKERVQSAEHGCGPIQRKSDRPHQDEYLYHARPVFRFPADGRSTTYVDFHIGRQGDKIASLAIEPGQGYILLQEVGCEVPGNIFTHKVPGGVDVFSLVIDCDQVTVGRRRA